jgi:hypothetical protein
MTNLSRNQQLYVDIMEQAKLRIHAIRFVINEKERWFPLLLQEFCWLQIRMLCEMIAYGCLVAHADITNRRTLKQKDIGEAFKRLEQLNADFFPRAIRLRRERGGLTFDLYNAPVLAQEEVSKVWGQAGDYLHRGSALKLLNADRGGPIVDLDKIINTGTKIMNLLEQHIISSADKKTHLIAVLADASQGGKAAVWVANSP